MNPVAIALLATMAVLALLVMVATALVAWVLWPGAVAVLRFFFGGRNGRR